MIRLSIWENIFLMNFTLLPYQHYVAMLLHNSCRLSVHRVPTNCKSGGQTTTMERRRHWHGQRHKCPDACAFLSRVSQECISPHVQRSPKCSPKRTHKNCRPDSWRRRITRDLFSLYICTYVYSLAYTRDTYIFVYNFFCALLCAFCAFFLALPQVAFHIVSRDLVPFPCGKSSAQSKYSEDEGKKYGRLYFRHSVFQLNDLEGPRPGKQIHSCIVHL